MKKYSIVLVTLLFPILAFAQEVALGDYLQQIFTAIGQLGGLNWALKIVLIINLLIASMKVSALRSIVWDKLGAAQILVAPVLGLVGAVLAYLVSGTALTLPNIIAFVMTGAGSIILHELMDAAKALPWVGAKYVAMIEGFMDALGAKKS